MLGFLLIFGFLIQAVMGCSYPAVPLHATVSINDDQLRPGSIATYSCDSGYELLGTKSRICNTDELWSEETPFCTVNIAFGKPSRQSTISGRGMPEAAVDGQPARLPFFDNCARTRAESFPWWFANLLDRQEINIVRLTFGASCCDNEPVQLEIRIGDNMDVLLNPLCVTFRENMELGQTVTLKCHEPLVGTFLSIHLRNARPNVLSLCEVSAFSMKAFPRDNCPFFPGDNPNHIASFNNTCYTFYNERTATWNEAKDYCEHRGGELIQGSSPGFQGFISWEISKKRQEGNGVTNFWMGLLKNPKDQQWHFINNDTTVYTFWAVPLNSQNVFEENKTCASFNGNAGWLWAPSDCDRKMNWICQFGPNSCGNPDRLENTTLVSSKSFVKGEAVVYECLPGKVLLGDSKRTCQKDGKWSGFSPSCIHVDCGQPNNVKHGQITLNEGNAEFNSVAEYSCEEGYVLSGSQQRICQSTGLWSGVEPTCEAVSCPSPPLIKNGWFIVNHEARVVNTSITYFCKANYVLEGTSTRRCLINGHWEGSSPICIVNETLPVTRVYQDDIASFPTGRSRVEFSSLDNQPLSFNITDSNKNQESVKNSSEPDVDVAGLLDIEAFNLKMKGRSLGGYIAIGVICGLALIIALIVIIVFCICKRSRKAKSSNGSGNGDSTDISSFDSSSSDSDSNRLFHYYKRAWENLRLEQEKHPKDNFDILRASPKTIDTNPDDPLSKTRPKQMVTLDMKREKGPFHFFGAGKGTIEHLRDSGEILVNPEIQALYATTNTKDKKKRSQKATLDQNPNISKNPELFYHSEQPFSTFKHHGYP